MTQITKAELIDKLNFVDEEVLRSIIPQKIQDYQERKLQAAITSNKEDQKLRLDSFKIMATPDIKRPTGWEPKLISVRLIEIFGGRRSSIEYTLMEEAPISYIGENDLKKKVKKYREKKTVRNGIEPDHDYEAYGSSPVTSMSLNVEEPTVVVFILKSPKNIYFSRDGTPFSYDPANAKDCFFEATRVDKDGNFHDARQSSVENSRVAYMYVKPKLGSGVVVYDAPFNIHIDFEGLGFESSFRIPVIIDPDVRFPGGSGDN